LDDYSKTIWHNRLGHFYHNNLSQYLELHNVKKHECLNCKISKLKSLPHNGIPPTASGKLETIHSDLIGPMGITSGTGKKFILTFIDEFSRKSWIFLLKRKRDVPNSTIQFFKIISNRFNCNIKFFKTDIGLEFKNKKIEKYCLNNGITKLYSPPYNPENNGKAERFNQTLINCTRTLLSWSKLDQKFWVYAINYANYLYNINPHRSIGNAIPNEVFFNKKVDLRYIKTFGCIAYYKNFSQNKGKFESNSKKGIFLGLNFRTHCYIVMDFKDLKLHLVREVVFDEDQPANFTLPDENYKEQKASQVIHYFSNDSDIVIENEPYTSNEQTTLNDEYIIDDVLENLNSFKISSDNNFHLNPNTINNTIGKRKHSFADNILNKMKNVGQYHLNPSTKSNSDFDINDININSKKQNVGQYQFNPSNKRSLDDENIDMFKNKNIKENEVHNNLPVKRPENNIDNENNKRIEISNNASEIANITLNVPSSFHEAVTGKNKEELLNAINDELNNLYSNKIITYISKLPEDKKPIKTKWIFNIKKDSNNMITRFKAHLVAEGFSQI